MTKAPSLPLLLAIAAGCSSDPSDPSSGDEPDGGGPPPGPLTLESPAFSEGDALPPVHRCANAPSPVLEWSNAPPGTQSFAVVLRDLDYMNGFLHWVIYDIPASLTGLPEAVPAGYQPATPAGARQAVTLGQGYFGPCSLVSVNTYEFTVYALDVATLPDVGETSPGTDAVPVIEAHSLADARLSVESGPTN
jgi:Raf kinase inhibitor-like YbhB/YbcL family protein